jgi:hypothetical protein
MSDSPSLTHLLDNDNQNPSTVIDDNNINSSTTVPDVIYDNNNSSPENAQNLDEVYLFYLLKLKYLSNYFYRV